MKIAICPGSFDPVTNGHIDIIERASKMADKLIVAVLENSSKQPAFSTGERVELLKKVTSHIKNIEILCFSGLLIDFAKKSNAKLIVKGLRAVSDFEYEFQMSLINKELSSDIETVFLTSAAKYMYLSSSVVKEVAKNCGDISAFVPKEILKDVVERLSGGLKNGTI